MTHWSEGYARIPTPSGEDMDEQRRSILRRYCHVQEWEERLRTETGIEDAESICEAATPRPWRVSSTLDAGNGRSIGAYDKEPSLDYIRVSTPTTFGKHGYRTVTNKQRDLDAKFIAESRSFAPAAIRVIRELRSFVQDVADSFDCDGDAHEHGTPCRRCEARKLLGRSDD